MKFFFIFFLLKLGTVISYQLSVISYQLAVISYQLSGAGGDGEGEGDGEAGGKQMTND